MPSTQQILGIRFFNGKVDEAIDRMFGAGGCLVAPSGTCFARLERDAVYREAMTKVDVAIPDSGAMVLLWKVLRRQTVGRMSGLKYLQHLSARFFETKTADVLWVVPNEAAQRNAAQWLRQNQFICVDENFYVAPFYDSIVQDPRLLNVLEMRRPHHVVIGIGSGPQEKLGVYLRDHLSYRPAIHCIGAALGFLTGDQVAIPDWADRFYLGWLFRLVAQPGIFIPRLTRALRLPWLVFRYGEQLPPLRGRK